MFSKILLIFLAVYTVRSQNPSPCPDILTYEPRNTEMDRWYAVITLSSREQLRGIWLRVTLDRAAELVGNVFGDVTSNDNKEFMIRSPNFVLEPGATTPVRIFVKYNAASVVPSIDEINVNGRTICSSTNPVTTTQRNTAAQRPTSGSSNSNTGSSSSNTRPRPRPTSSRPTTTNSRPTSSNSNNRPVTNNNNSNRPNRPSNSNNRPSNNAYTDNYDVDFVDEDSNSRPSNNRPNNNRPSSSNFNNNNNRPTSSSNNFNGGSNNFNNNRPANNFNTGSDYENGDDYNNQNGNTFNNRPTSGSSSFGNNNNNRPDDSYNQNNFNQGGESSGLAVNAESSDDYFIGDISLVVNRPQSTHSTRPNNNHNRQSCGTVAAQPRPLISYGQNTIPGQWPWHAALYHSKGIQLMYTCGGTLISTRHILTAAHCVTKPHTNRGINPQNIVVYLGKYNLKKFGSEIQDKEVSDIYVHPEYNYRMYYNDIAILRLADPAHITNYVRPVCVWEENDDLNEIVGRSGTVVGWGFDQNRELSTTLMQAQMPVVSTSTCIYSNREFYSQFTSEKSYCAGFRNGTSVCNGDSGGGMVYPRRGTSGSNTVWQIRGIVSVGVALQGHGVCDPSQYIVFTDVAKHVDFIQQILENYP